MMDTRFCSTVLVCLFSTGIVLSQRPPRPQGPPPGGGAPTNGDVRPDAPQPPAVDWVRPLDTNANGKLEADEFHAAIDRTFAELDRNGNGILDPGEISPPRGDRRPPMGDGINAPRPAGPRPGDGKRLLPPFFFRGRLDPRLGVSKTEFETSAKQVFAEMDRNADGVLQKDEQRPPRPREGNDRPENAPPPPPNARFIGAEMRFGDKLVKGQPFSAETVVEDTRRLFDGSTVTKESRGATYRDGAGRTRREQPLELVGGFNVVGKDGKPQMLIFINDFPSLTQYFIDLNNNVAHKNPLDANAPAPPEPDQRPGAKTESLGTKDIEGIQAVGKRITFEIPTGRLGNDKPIPVVTEEWFSPELQVVILSRHVDPIAGEHVFRLINIKRSEPSADLFSIPQGVRVESRPDRD